MACMGISTARCRTRRSRASPAARGSKCAGATEEASYLRRGRGARRCAHHARKENKRAGWRARAASGPGAAASGGASHAMPCHALELNQRALRPQPRSGGGARRPKRRPQNVAQRVQLAVELVVHDDVQLGEDFVAVVDGRRSCLPVRGGAGGRATARAGGRCAAHGTRDNKQGRHTGGVWLRWGCGQAVRESERAKMCVGKESSCGAWCVAAARARKKPTSFKKPASASFTSSLILPVHLRVAAEGRRERGRGCRCASSCRLPR